MLARATAKVAGWWAWGVAWGVAWGANRNAATRGVGTGMQWAPVTSAMHLAVVTARRTEVKPPGPIETAMRLMWRGERPAAFIA